jgi:hypothetical protein
MYVCMYIYIYIHTYCKPICAGMSIWWSFHQPRESIAILTNVCTQIENAPNFDLILQILRLFMCVYFHLCTHVFPSICTCLRARSLRVYICIYICIVIHACSHTQAFIAHAYMLEQERLLTNASPRRVLVHLCCQVCAPIHTDDSRLCTMMRVCTSIK